MGILPVKAPGIIKTALGVRKKSGREPRLMIAGRDLNTIGRVDELLQPVGAHSRVLLHEVRPSGSREALKAFQPDIVVIAAGDGDLVDGQASSDLTDFIHEVKAKRMPWVPVVLDGTHLESLALIDQMADVARTTASRIVCLSMDSPCAPEVTLLADQILDVAPAGLTVSLGASFSALRPSASRRTISRFTAQNGVVATFGLAPGADIAVLSANQIRMVLEIAAIHGENIDASRAKEVIGTIAGGMVLRLAARSLLGLIPVAGWIIKGGVSAAGTYGLGRAAVEFYSNPQFTVELERSLRDVASRVLTATGKEVE